MSKKHITTAIFISLAVVSLSAVAKNNNNQTHSVKSVNVKKEVKLLSKVAPKLNPHVLKLALTAYNNAHQKGISDPSHIFTIVNYSLPDNKKRLWVFDLNDNKLLYHTWVAQGKHTGLVVAKHFSNRPGSLESSLGLYQTGKAYYGNDGYSLRLHGLSKGFNTNAYSRAIVMHGAWYVSSKFVHEYHRVGRSWGCLAVPKKLIRPIVNTVKNGSLIFAYDNNPYWLAHSEYIHPSVSA